MNNLTKILNIIYKNIIPILLFILGLLLISWIIYNRLIRTRESIDIVFYYQFSTILLYFYLMMINIMYLLFTILTILLEKGLFTTSNSNKEQSVWYTYLKRHIKTFLNIPNKAFETVYIYGIKKIPKLYSFYDHCCYIFIKYEKIIIYGLPIFMLLCQFIVLSALIIDVFYFQKFHWFYKSLILLLGPLLSNTLIYCLNDYAQEGITEMEKFANAVYNRETKAWTYTWRDDMAEYFNDDNFKQLTFSHSNLYIVLALTNWIKYYSSSWYIIKIFHITKYSLYIITWGYLLLLSLIN